jgi:Mrp family chromosome partitioning ATPase
LRGTINREIGRGHAATLQLVERSRARERSIQQAILELSRQVNSEDAGLQQLEGRAESIRTVLHGFQKKLEQTAAGPAFIASNSTIISRANPSATSSPSKAPVLAGAGGFVGLTLGGLLALFLEHRDKTFRTSAQVQQQVSARAVGATPRATLRARKYPADLILGDNRSAFAEAFRLSWAHIQLAIEDPERAAGNFGRGPGKVLGITSAVTGEGKSTHALALARTAVLAGDGVVVVDADLRRSGVSRLLGGNFRFTLDDFLQSRCTARDLIAVEERSGLHFVPSTPVEVLWTNDELRRFTGLIDDLRAQFAFVIIDMPPVLGLAETIRLTVAADSVVLIVRWGRTERQLVQYALDRLRTAGAIASAVILNDVDLKAQQRRGDRDQNVVYRDGDLYRAKQKYREPTSRQPASALANASVPNPEAPAPQRRRTKAEHDPANASDTARSDILRLYDRNPGK